MRINDSLYRFTAPILLAGAIAAAPATVLAAGNDPTPGVTPSPPAERNIEQKTDRGYERSAVEPEASDAVTGEDDPNPQVTPTPPAERNIGHGSDSGTEMDRSEAMRADEPNEPSAAVTGEDDPNPQVTPTPPAERNIEQDREG